MISNHFQIETLELAKTKQGNLTDIIHQEFSVHYDYPVCFTGGLFKADNSLFADVLRRREPEKRHRFVVFIDSNVASARPDLIPQIIAYADHWPTCMELVCPPMVLPGGESIKNSPELVVDLQHSLYENAIDRHSFLVAIGGGAFLDFLGYVAATTHRGLRLIRVPTTVLAQNDSGVGVKNGMNAFGVKNFVGTFAPPFAVLNDIDFLRTLSRRDCIAGTAEAVKVALIRDAEFFSWLESNIQPLSDCEPGALALMIRRCAELHMHQIAKGGDPFEAGSIRPLDYGHWAAHKLELLSEHSLRHGEAVAIGLALDTRYSVLVGLLSEGIGERVYRLLNALGFPLWHDALDFQSESGRWRLLEGLDEFQEHMGGDLTITLLREIGQGEEVHQMHSEAILDAVAWLRQMKNTR